MAALKESIEPSGNGHHTNGNGKKLGELTKEELYEKAEQADIKGRSTMNKDELIQAIKKNK